MKALRWILPVLALFLATSAFAQEVKFTFDKTVDFSMYKTYRWEKHPMMKDFDEPTLRQLGAAFDAALVKSGLTRSKTDKADLVIVYQVAVQQEKEATSYIVGWNMGPGWGGVWYTNLGPVATVSSSFDLGSVALDMFDPLKEELIWRGIVSKVVDKDAKPDKKQNNINKAANKLMKNYPPKVKK
jgi:hypothetical protein